MQECLALPVRSPGTWLEWWQSLTEFNPENYTYFELRMCWWTQKCGDRMFCSPVRGCLLGGCPCFRSEELLSLRSHPPAPTDCSCEADGSLFSGGHCRGDMPSYRSHPFLQVLLSVRERSCYSSTLTTYPPRPEMFHWTRFSHPRTYQANPEI